jgi:flagellar basal body P-ring formation protein FlgA
MKYSAASVVKIVSIFVTVIYAFAGRAGYAQQTNAASAPIPNDRSIRIMLEREMAGINGRVEISVGTLDPRVTLSPCAQIEPFLPKGTPVWGRISIGMRCREGAGWTVFLPVTVKVFGAALVAKKAIANGIAPTEADVESIDGEVSREPGTPILDLKQIEGRVLARAIFPGQMLRLEHFRMAPVISQGDQVKLMARGAGFSVSTDAEALSHALDGQSIRARTETGRVVSGIARAGRIVELRY